MTKSKITDTILSILVAIILLQTLFFKFTADVQSVKLFTILDMEPWGRIGTGILELIASVCIVFPRTRVIGAILGLGLMSGAIFFHLTKLGIYFDGDPVLFIYALIAWFGSLVIVIRHRKSLLSLFPIHKK